MTSSAFSWMTIALNTFIVTALVFGVDLDAAGVQWV